MRLLTYLALISWVFVACSAAAPEATPPPTATIAPTATPPSTVRTVDEPTPLPTVEPTVEEAQTRCAEPPARVEVLSFASDLAGRDVTYRVYIPPCYDTTGAAYPTLYMLHGLGQGMDDEMWDRIGIDDAATTGYLEGDLPPMLIVMPDGTDAQHDIDTSNYDRVIAEELIPLVDQTYCTQETRAIGGLSRGAFWAYSVAFQYPDLFTKVGGHSGYFYPDEQYPANNPYELVSGAQGIEALGMYLDYGAEDNIVPGLPEAFAEQLRTQRGIEPVFILNDTGRHDDAYWAEQSPAYLAWYSQNWPRSVEQFPECAS